jgi:hypothetical protein
MAVNLSPYGGVGAQFLDNSGNVLTGGKIFTYAAGTTTNQATYTTSAGNIPHSNPIILDASGRVPSGGEIWLTDGFAYKFILRDANDVLIATYDNVTGINSNFVAFTNQQEIQTATAGQTVFNLTTMTYQPATNSLTVFVDGVNQYGPGAQYAYLETDGDTVTFVNGLHVGAEVKFTTSQLNSSASQSDAFQVSYTPPFIGSVTTNVGDKLAQTVSVTDFGAVGDGVTDDSSAIQAAIDSLDLQNGGLLYLPQGTYVIDAPLILPNGVSLIGSGVDSTILKKTTATASLIESTAIPAFLGGSPVGYPICVIHAITGTNISYSAGRIEGIRISGGTDPNTTNVVYGIFTRAMVNVRITDCVIDNVQYGFVQVGDSLVECSINNIRINRVFGGFYTNFSTGLNTDGLYVSNFKLFGFFFNSCLYSHIQNVVAELGGTRALFPDASTSADYYNLNIGGPIAYYINGCVGSTFRLGSELHNGTGIFMRGNQTCAIENCYFAEISTDYSGAKRITAAYFVDNYDLRFAENRFLFATPPYTGTPSVWNYIVDSLFGRFEYENIRYINAFNSTAETGEGWVNLSGTGTGIKPFAFVPTFTFGTPGDLSIGTPGSNNIGTYYRVGNVVYFSLVIEYTPTFTTSAGAFQLTGIPFPCGAVAGAATISFVSDTIDWSPSKTQLTAAVNDNTSYISINQQQDATTTALLGSGNFTSGTTFRIAMTGSYLMAQ